MELFALLSMFKRKISQNSIFDRRPFKRNKQIQKKPATLTRIDSSGTHEFMGYQIPVDLMMLTGGGPDTFDAISASHIKNLQKWIGLNADHTVLEIGCGIGRDAIPLTQILLKGKYIGIDIIERSINWCSQNISFRNSNFHFYHYDVKDQLHNNSGTIRTADITLPLNDGSVDRIILFSVFTHMFRSDIEHYLREFRRVLKPDGLVYATTFIFNEAILKSARATNLTPFDLRFEHEIGSGCRINDPEHPLGAVAYTREEFDEMVHRSGMRYAKPFLKGGWSGFYPDPEDGQDVAILTSGDNSMDATQRYQYLKHHPYSTLNASLGRAEGIFTDDRRIIERCLSAYRASGAGPDERYSTGFWASINKRQEQNHRILLEGSLAEASTVLRDPATSSLFYGFDNMIPEFTAAMIATPEQMEGQAHLFQDNLIRLAEAVAALRVENPEGGPWLENGHLSTDELLDSIEKRVGCPLRFPNVFSDEFGLQSSRGLVAYRAIQAIYQAYRIKSLVNHIQNPRILEIGAGLGRTAFYSRQMGVTDYTIIDLPLTGISQAYYLMRVCGEDAIQLRGEQSFSPKDKIKIFDPSYFLEQDGHYDLIVNVDSLTEMDQATAEAYIRRISSVTQQFLSINHEANPFTVAQLFEGNRILRFPYWMRPGYVEEIIMFHQKQNSRIS